MRLRHAVPTALVFLLCAASQSSALGEDAEDSLAAGTSPRCLWMIYDAVHQVGVACFPGEDAELKSAARDGVRDLEALLVAHHPSKPTAASLADQRARMRRETVTLGKGRTDLCSGDTAELYRRMRDIGPAKMRDAVQEKLAHPEDVDKGDCF